jgi:Fungal specific transcription factor domain
MSLDQDPTNSGYSSPQDDQQMKRDLVLNATHQRQIEPFAIANSAIKINVPKEVSLEILNYHWCWIHPLFLFVYRPAFTRGMAMVDYNAPDSRDPYFSETLLKVIHAHGSRFLDHDVYQHQYQSSTNSHSPMATAFSPQDFSQRMVDEARYGLAIDMLKQSSIPTIQALLQQSAREVVLGNASQAWTFAGVAFRMALDLGIHLPSDKLQSFFKSLTPEDIEIRKRLFWSCYTWDKILSLYLGRMPGFTHPATHDISLTFMDDYSDTDLWVPYYGETPKPDHSNAPSYPPCPGYVISCFRQLCKLCVILNDLMQSIYSPEAAARREEDEDSAESKAANEEPFIRISRGLRDWLLSLPSHLRIRPDQMPQLAPPVHIVSLNLLYHTTVILLHRPMILGARDLSLPGPSRSYQICLQATAAIHDLLVLQSNTFGLSHVSYLNVYSAYTAATVAVLRFERDCRDGEDYSSCAKATGLSFLVDVLDRSSSSMPVLERSSAIIRKRMRAVFDQRLDEGSHIGAQAAGFIAPNTQEMDLAAPTVFQQPSTIASHGYSQAELNGGFVAPMQWQSGLRSSLYSEQSSVVDDFLPAFPGQRFPVGSEHSFGSSEVDSQGRSALLGYSLDPHPRLNAGDIDWQLMETFERHRASTHSM